MTFDLAVASLIFLAYLIVTLVISVYGCKLNETTPDDYFLADRKVGPIVLFFTLIATNFSAFFFLGFSGAGYRTGYSFYGIMSFGTALVALSFYVIGYKAWSVAKEHKYITPPEMIAGILQSKALRAVYLFVMVFFTLPYLAIQPIGAGHILHHISDGQIPYFLGAVVLTVFIVLYVFIGGMRTVAWTDVFQGVIMLVCIVTATILIANQLGGLSHANTEVYKIKPELFSRAGADGKFTVKIWFSFMLLFFLSVPMFPQMFMRFLICRTPKSLQISALLYPLVTAVLFIFPITIGVLGNLTFGGLEGKAADQILPKMLGEFAPGWLAAAIMMGAIAAFMSTMDSQLLALSSMLTRDIYVTFLNKDASLESQVIVGRVLVVILAIMGLGIAYNPPDTIFGIVKQAFMGLAVLFPTTLAALYWKKTNAVSCILSILAGEIILAGFYLKLIDKSWAFGFLPLIPIMVICSLIIIIGSFVFPRKT